MLKVIALSGLSQAVTAEGDPGLPIAGALAVMLVMVGGADKQLVTVTFVPGDSTVMCGAPLK
jgi:hypothetical protein